MTRPLHALLRMALVPLAACAYGPDGGYDPEGDPPTQATEVSQVPSQGARERQARTDLFPEALRPRTEKGEAPAPAPILEGVE